MEIVHRQCGGADVHAKTVAACARHVDATDRITHEVRTFGTTTGVLVLTNAQHVRNIPERKSDKNDAVWLAPAGPAIAERLPKPGRARELHAPRARDVANRSRACGCPLRSRRAPDQSDLALNSPAAFWRSVE